MLPNKTLKTLKKVYGALSCCGCLPYKTTKSESSETTLKNILPTELQYVHAKVAFLTLISHTVFILIRLFQVYKVPNQKFFLKFFHFAWSAAFIMACWLHITLFISRFEVLTFCNGLFQFYGSFFAMPGARMSAKCRRKDQNKPCTIDMLLAAFIAGAIMNVLMTIQIFLMNKQSYQFLYSTLPACWVEKFPAVIVFCVLYEMAILCIIWTLLMFFIVIHLVHLLGTGEYLAMLRKNTRGGILKLYELRHQYRSIQVLHNQYNFFIAKFMPLELFVVISLTFAGNIGTIRMAHSEDRISIPEMAVLPLVSVLTIAFQIIFYQRAGNLHHLSSFYEKSSKKGLFQDKTAKMYLRSFPPLCVKVGTLLDIRKFTVVRFIGGVIVGTARLSILFFR